MTVVDDFQTEMEAIRLLAIAALLEALNEADAPNLSAGQAAQALSEALVELVLTYGEQAAQAAVRYLELDRAEARVRLPSPRPADLPPIEQIERSMGWALRPLDDGDFESAERQAAGSLQRLVETPGRDTIWNATVQAGTTFARVPRPGACSFCITLAARGAVYQRNTVLATVGGRSTSRRPPGSTYHDNCHCGFREVRPDNEDDLPDVNRRAEAAWSAYLDVKRGRATIDGFTAYLKDHPFDSFQ